MPRYSPSWPCEHCAHRHKDEKRDIPTCDAFPKAIPWLMLSGQDDHTQPLEGDGGIRYEPAVD